MAGISQRELTTRRERLLDELPKHAWDYHQAGIAAGYSDHYSRTRLKTYVGKDGAFCKSVLAKKAEIEAQTLGEREKCLHVLDNIIHDENAPRRDRIKAVEVRGKICGWLSETRVLEVAERQRELTQAEKDEARRMALLRFDTRALPGEQPATPPNDLPESDENHGGTRVGVTPQALRNTGSPIHPENFLAAPNQDTDSP